MEALPLAAAMIGGLDVSAAVILGFGGNFERSIVDYDCGQPEPLRVEYINAAPNFLAIIAIEGGPKRVFVTVSAASGARYVTGEYEWWTKGAEATLANIVAPDAEPVVCNEIIDTP